MPILSEDTRVYRSVIRETLGQGFGPIPQATRLLGDRMPVPLLQRGLLLLSGKMSFSQAECLGWAWLAWLRGEAPSRGGHGLSCCFSEVKKAVGLGEDSLVSECGLKGIGGGQKRGRQGPGSLSVHLPRTWGTPLTCWASSDSPTAGSGPDTQDSLITSLGHSRGKCQFPGMWAQ